MKLLDLYVNMLGHILLSNGFRNLTILQACLMSDVLLSGHINICFDETLGRYLKIRALK